MLYNLVYYINNRKIETVKYGIQKPLALSIKKKLANSTHKLGTIKLENYK